MKPYSLIIEDFLPDYPAVRAWADKARFDDLRSPVDGVVYPNIAFPTERIGDEVHRLLCDAMGQYVKINHLFARMSPADVHCPNIAHNDAAMGQWSLMLYLNRPEHCRGGTSLLQHESGFEIPGTAAEMEAARECANMPQCWSVTMTCPMKPNRAFIFAADLMHRADPCGGFGATPKDARIVLTAFFDLAEAA